MGRPGIEHRSALGWSPDARADLVLTDPPHLDNFENASAHLTFVKAWLPRALGQWGDIVFHTCGQDPQEYMNYLSVGKSARVLSWPHESGFHRLMIYGGAWTGDGTLRLAKPEPLWSTIIKRLCPEGGLVRDPFAGRGEIPRAARATGRRWDGCELQLDAARVCWEDGL